MLCESYALGVVADRLDVDEATKIKLLCPFEKRHFCGGWVGGRSGLRGSEREVDDGENDHGFGGDSICARMDGGCFVALIDELASWPADVGRLSIPAIHQVLAANYRFPHISTRILYGIANTSILPVWHTLRHAILIT